MPGSAATSSGSSARAPASERADRHARPASSAATSIAAAAGRAPHRSAIAYQAETAPGTVMVSTPRSGTAPPAGAAAAGARPLALITWASPSWTRAMMSPPTAHMCG